MTSDDDDTILGRMSGSGPEMVSNFDALPPNEWAIPAMLEEEAEEEREAQAQTDEVLGELAADLLVGEQRDLLLDDPADIVLGADLIYGPDGPDVFAGAVTAQYTKRMDQAGAVGGAAARATKAGNRAIAAGTKLLKRRHAKAKKLGAKAVAAGQKALGHGQKAQGKAAATAATAKTGLAAAKITAQVAAKAKQMGLPASTAKAAATAAVVRKLGVQALPSATRRQLVKSVMPAGVMPRASIVGGTLDPVADALKEKEKDSGNGRDTSYSEDQVLANEAAIADLQGQAAEAADPVAAAYDSAVEEYNRAAELADEATTQAAAVVLALLGDRAEGEGFSSAFTGEAILSALANLSGPEAAADLQGLKTRAQTWMAKIGPATTRVTQAIAAAERGATDTTTDTGPTGGAGDSGSGAGDYGDADYGEGADEGADQWEQVQRFRHGDDPFDDEGGGRPYGGSDTPMDVDQRPSAGSMDEEYAAPEEEEPASDEDRSDPAYYSDEAAELAAQFDEEESVLGAGAVDITDAGPTSRSPAAAHRASAYLDPDYPLGGSIEGRSGGEVVIEEELVIGGEFGADAWRARRDARRRG